MVDTFLDSSGVIALARPEDQAHAKAVELTRTLPFGSLTTNNYVVVETLSLIDRRWGRGAAETASREFFSRMPIAWIDRDVHEAAMRAFAAARSRKVSLVDLVSFEFMRREGITRAFTFDADFRRAGFEVVPG